MPSPRRSKKRISSAAQNVIRRKYSKRRKSRKSNSGLRKPSYRGGHDWIPTSKAEISVNPKYFSGAEGLRCFIVEDDHFYGDFQKKYLECGRELKMIIDQICEEGRFTQEWYPSNDPDVFRMKKIPLVLLIKLLQGIPENDIKQTLIMRGAYPISMYPEKRTCVNVISGRRVVATKAGETTTTIEKFSLYYPNNDIMNKKYGNRWPLLSGYSFRTAVLQGSLNRNALKILSTDEELTRNGLIIDATSTYEDCAYVKEYGNDDEKIAAIEKLISLIKESHGSLLAPSYNPTEQKDGLSALESEWNVFRLCLPNSIASPVACFDASYMISKLASFKEETFDWRKVWRKWKTAGSHVLLPEFKEGDECVLFFPMEFVTDIKEGATALVKNVDRSTGTVTAQFSIDLVIDSEDFVTPEAHKAWKFMMDLYDKIEGRDIALPSDGLITDFNELNSTIEKYILGKRHKQMIFTNCLASIFTIIRKMQPMMDPSVPHSEAIEELHSYLSKSVSMFADGYQPYIMVNAVLLEIRKSLYDQYMYILINKIIGDVLDVRNASVMQMYYTSIIEKTYERSFDSLQRIYSQWLEEKYYPEIEILYCIYNSSLFKEFCNPFTNTDEEEDVPNPKQSRVCFPTFALITTGNDASETVQDDVKKMMTKPTTKWTDLVRMRRLSNAEMLYYCIVKCLQQGSYESLIMSLTILNMHSSYHACAVYVLKERNSYRVQIIDPNGYQSWNTNVKIQEQISRICAGVESAMEKRVVHDTSTLKNRCRNFVYSGLGYCVLSCYTTIRDWLENTKEGSLSEYLETPDYSSLKYLTLLHTYMKQCITPDNVCRRCLDMQRRADRLQRHGDKTYVRIMTHCYAPVMLIS